MDLIVDGEEAIILIMEIPEAEDLDMEEVETSGKVNHLKLIQTTLKISTKMTGEDKEDKKVTLISKDSNLQLLHNLINLHKGLLHRIQINKIQQCM